MRSETKILCIDIGTSSLKAAVLGVTDATAGVSLCAYSRTLYRKHGSEAYGEPARAGNTKADYGRHSGDWEEAFYRAVADLQRTVAFLELSALCISANGPTIVPVMDDGSALMPLQWFDGANYRTKETQQSASFFLPKAAHFRREYAELYSRVKYFFSCQEWLSYKLGAAPFTTLPSPAYEPYYWDAAQCRSSGLDIEKFQHFVPLGSVVGTVSDAAASKFMLPAGLPIVSGAPDFIMAILGCASINDGDVCDRAGSSEGINCCTKKHEVPTDFAKSVRVLPHPIDGLWNVSVVIPESGSLLDRYRIETGQEHRGYDALLGSIESGVDKHGREVLEVIAAQEKRALELLASLGFRVRRMTVSGGQAKNTFWNNLRAKLLDCTLQVTDIADAELAGCAACSLLALGAASTLEAAVRKVVRVKEVFG